MTAKSRGRMTNEAILYRTHFVNPMVRREIGRLRSEVPDGAHWVVLYLKDDAADLDMGENDSRMYRRADLAALPYPKKLAAIDWPNSDGHNDLPVLAFYRESPDYDYYWVIEYDVRYTGHWGDLLGELRTSQAAFLGTTLQDHDQNPGWWWWRTRVNPPQRALQRVRCFTPFCRLSNAALAAVDEWYRDGGSGHYEFVWPSVCKTSGLLIEDIGGWSRYTPERWRGQHYLNTPLKPSLSPGFFVYKPVFKDDWVSANGLKHARGPMLWHPVKD